MMRPNSYAILSRAVEEGVVYGWQCARKHTDNPPTDELLESIEREVMNAICEVFTFDDDDEKGGE